MIRMVFFVLEARKLWIRPYIKLLQGFEKIVILLKTLCPEVRNVCRMEVIYGSSYSHE